MIDIERLATWMDGQGLGVDAPIDHAFVSGGTQNEIYEIRRGDVHGALRIPPPSAPESRDVGILREWRIIEALDGTDVPHTAAIAACDDRSVLGRTFYLMGYVDGWSPMNTDGWPEPFDTDLEARKGLAFELVDGISLLSRVDWQAKGLDDLGHPDGFHERQVDRWTAFLERIKGRELPGFDEASAWLREHRPIDFVPGLMHGDYQFANVMYRHGAPARMAAIVDWEMGTVGDPKLDLAWVVNGWPEDTSQPSGVSYVDMTGMPSRSAMLSRYSEVSGRQVDDIDYYCVLAKWKLAVVLEQGFQRAGDNAMLQTYGPVVLELMQGAADLAETLGLPLVTGPTTELVRERQGALSLLRLNRPEARNSLTTGLVAELGAGLIEAESDPDIRAVVLTGTGDRAFCSGMDLRSFSEGDVPGATPGESTEAFYRLLRGETSVPVIGAANGSAVAGGLELLLGCDVVIASREARFGLPEVKRGSLRRRRGHPDRQPDSAGGGPRADPHRRPGGCVPGLPGRAGQCGGGAGGRLAHRPGHGRADRRQWSPRSRRQQGTGPSERFGPGGGTGATGAMVGGGLRQRGRHGRRPRLRREARPGVEGPLR